MIANEREATALANLLKIARLRSEETGRRLAGLEAAAERTDFALRLLADAVSSEEAASRAAEVVGFSQLAGYLAGAAQKRAALEMTKSQIAAELETARLDLEAAFSESKKLEHLIERARLSAQRRNLRLEAASMGEAAMTRFVRAKSR